jgi:uncharacterized membrane protein YhaH (DUF805 family)
VTYKNKAVISAEIRKAEPRYNYVTQATTTTMHMTTLQALFSFRGRLCRSDYWLKGWLPLLPVEIINHFLFYSVDEPWGHQMGMVIGVLSLWPSAAILTKRWHDLGWSAWWFMIILIPIAQPVICPHSYSCSDVMKSVLAIEILLASLLILVGCILVGFVKGTLGPNRFGPDPLQ